MRTVKIMLAVLFCAVAARAETPEGLSRRIDDIQLGRNNGNQIKDLRVQDDATIGDDLTVTGDAAVTGAATVTGKTQADGELEANSDVDINLGAATEEIAVDQTNTVGQANTPLISVVDARTGANANATNEATLMISAAGTYGLAVTRGGVDFAGTLAVAGTATLSGKTQADGELEANDDVDINLGAATEEIAIDQTNTVGQANTPLISVVDARTGANANATNEATLAISSEGTYALAITKGGVDFAGTLNVAGDTSTKAVYSSGTFIEQDSSAGAFRLGVPAGSGWQLSTAGGGTIFQIQRDYARTGSIDALLVQTNTTIIKMPVSTNGFNLSGSLWNSNGYVCVWTP